jgi:hypothetical protein
MALSSMGLAALALASEIGLNVFPLYEPRPDGTCSCGDAHADRPKNIGKHPRVGGGFKVATTHPDQIDEWWSTWPLANIGLYPGASQLLVLDVDGAEGETRARLYGAYDVETLEATTARGVHRYFRLPAGVRVGNSARPELDVRAHNGYVLAPPSLHASGHVYRWRGDPDGIADIPSQTLAAILPPPPPPTPRPRSTPDLSLAAPNVRDERRVLAYADKLGYGLSDGRKQGAFRFAAFLAHDVGLDAVASYRFLAAWNNGNAPPLPEQLLQEIHDNARRYGGRSSGAVA